MEIIFKEGIKKNKTMAMIDVEIVVSLKMSFEFLLLGFTLLLFRLTRRQRIHAYFLSYLLQFSSNELKLRFCPFFDFFFKIRQKSLKVENVSDCCLMYNILG